MDSPILETGKGDVQIDASKIGTVWGPGVASGNGRVRRAVNDSTILEGEAGVLHVTNAGAGGTRDAYTGRLGAIWRSDDQRLALTGGVGGGVSRAAGNWGAADVGMIVTGRQESVRPVLQADFGYSGPLDRSRTFTVVDTDGIPAELRLPRNISGKISLGIELGNQDTSLLLGVSMIKFWQLDPSVVGEQTTDDDTYFAAGIGLKFRVD